ncbi:MULTISPECIES: hypothetical protein [Rhizobium]|uniref:hypothetical protein n=1 Tax=Rhizobium TaxID=379 RepID=UPI0007F16654|nr:MULTISPECIES: hypothetical protein [Rhizobium]ANK98789.1 hypothetical protein AMK00_CH03325 [Rhizobium sp. N621]ANL04917.1 hypothetical protein AMJ99_CH03401 [Rhizobium esperanzae]ANL10976.1 hypothetical protein AMJ98_CH03352 [Rhizobium sp. N1341]ANM35759.1 hypothetical protein AMK04_CH03406 [Rhizobium sp. N871]ANM41820.1 hypothetical protein AMK03_CH03355 [Rhizobium sp. N741]
MSRGFESEFKSVDLLLESECESRGVDGFCLAWIKFERQLRKLTANLIYQASDIKAADAGKIREAFYGHGSLDYNSFIGAIHHLSGVSVGDLIGDRYRILKKEIGVCYRNRQKIFHGQQTGQSLDREALLTRIASIREWCQLLAAGAADRYGYDGFTGNTSLFKTDRPDIVEAVDKAVRRRGWLAYAQSFQR